VKRLIAFYVEQLGTVMPHLAFRGQAPDKIYLGTGDRISTELKAAHRRPGKDASRRTEQHGAGCVTPRIALRCTCSPPQERWDYNVAFSHPDLSNVLEQSWANSSPAI
jgi:hypothetical protein